MLTAILIKVGLPLAGLAIGWLAKKWHIQPYLNAMADELDLHRATLARMEAKTPTDKPPKVPGAA